MFEAKLYHFGAVPGAVKSKPLSTNELGVDLDDLVIIRARGGSDSWRSTMDVVSLEANDAWTNGGRNTLNWPLDLDFTVNKVRVFRYGLQKGYVARAEILAQPAG